MKFLKKPLCLYWPWTMNNIYKSIQVMRESFGWDQSDSIPFLISALKEEIVELEESLDLSEEEFQDELADVLMYALSIVMDKNYDLGEIIDHKIEKVMKREY